MAEDLMTGSGLEFRIFDALKYLGQIDELGFNPDAEYAAASKEETIYRIIEDNDVIIVAGAFFGDEGKGKTIDEIAKHPSITMVARANSGENAGHTVVINRKKYIFHLCPSAVMNEGVTSYIGPECVMDPVSFMNKEISVLANENIDYKDKLFVGNVHIVAPYHKLMDLMRNLKDIPDDLSGLTLANVSTLQGMAPVHASKVSKTGPRLDDLFGDESSLRKILEKDMLNYQGMMLARNLDENTLLKICEEKINRGMKRIPEHIIGFLKAEGKIEYMIDLYAGEVRKNKLFPARRDVVHEISLRLKNGEKLGIECPQSYFLSNKTESHWGSSTSADTKADAALADLGVNIRKYRHQTVNVHKVPPSRVGAGSNPVGFVPQLFYSEKGIDTIDDIEGVCTDYDSIQRQFWSSIKENGILEPTVYEDRTGRYLVNVAMAVSSSREYGECGATTRKPRVLGVFDCVAHAKVMEEQGPYTSISAVDRLDKCDKTGVCIAYVFYHPENRVVDSNGKVYFNSTIIKPGDEFPNERVLKYCHPIIKVIDGWKNNPVNRDKWNPEKGLPKGLQEFIGAIEHFTGAEIISIGNGPESDDLIYIKKTKHL